MRKKSYQHLILVYFLIIVLELLAELLGGIKEIRLPIYIIKPLLMPMLMLILYKAIHPNPINSLYKLVFAALFFSWWGDILLMFQMPDLNLFLPGLISFLIAHICYILAFRKITITPIQKNITWAPIAVALFGFGLIAGLERFGNEAFDEMKVPVIIYATVIMMMVIAAVFRYSRVNIYSFKWVMLGAILFLISDSMIAVGKFSDYFVSSPNVLRVLIMLTYTLGQFYIVKGVILQFKRRQ
jgi:uncharacterized membrane protein YhhN